jgi:hypothetical protein
MDDFVMSRVFGCILSCAVAVVGCADAERIEPVSPSPVSHTASFVGHVYDGASGTRLDGYAISGLAGTTSFEGTVDAGRFALGDLSVWDDYTVIIVASGYRPFQSHNARVGLPPNSEGIATTTTHQTLHFDAYLFPTSLEAPAVTFNITTAQGAQPSGAIRLRPISSSLLADEPVETPSGVPGQLWTNDEDLLASSFNQSFSGGEASFDAGKLVYGVTYQIDIYDVVGFQPLTDFYTAGVEGNKTIELVEELTEPLAVVTSNHGSCMPPAGPTSTSGAVVTIAFNQDIEAHDGGYPGGPAEALDDGLSMTSPDANSDTIVNSLHGDVSDNAQERGVTLGFAGNLLTISWNPSVGLATVDPGDPITQVVYSGLANAIVRRVGAPSSAASLAALLGITTITCPP